MKKIIYFGIIILALLSIFTSIYAQEDQESVDILRATYDPNYTYLGNTFNTDSLYVKYDPEAITALDNNDQTEYIATATILPENLKKGATVAYGGPVPYVHGYGDELVVYSNPKDPQDFAILGKYDFTFKRNFNPITEKNKGYQLQVVFPTSSEKDAKMVYTRSQYVPMDTEEETRTVKLEPKEFITKKDSIKVNYYEPIGTTDSVYVKETGKWEHIAPTDTLLIKKTRWDYNETKVPVPRDSTYTAHVFQVIGEYPLYEDSLNTASIDSTSYTFPSYQIEGK